MCTSVQEAPHFLRLLCFLCTIYAYNFLHNFVAGFSFHSLLCIFRLALSFSVFRWFVCLLLHAFALLIFLLFFLVSFLFPFPLLWFFVCLLVCLFVCGQPVGQCYNATDDSRLAITIPVFCPVSPQSYGLYPMESIPCSP